MRSKLKMNLTKSCWNNKPVKLNPSIEFYSNVSYALIITPKIQYGNSKYAYWDYKHLI